MFSAVKLTLILPQRLYFWIGFQLNQRAPHHFQQSFRAHPILARRIEHVLQTMPEEYRKDLLSDPSFLISLDDFTPGKGRTVMLAHPSTSGSSRCVVLKPRLEICSETFCCYIIAHELAHAWLNNGGWGTITDREEAADALAASWGFDKVPYE